MSKNKGGRKSKYHTHVEPRLKEIEAWARDGLTEEQIAKNLGVAYSTFRKYKDEYPAFSSALKKGKEVVDIEVENALLKRALGYEYEEVKTFIEEVDGKKKKKRLNTCLPMYRRLFFGYAIEKDLSGVTGMQ